jgi:hypothetical protein
MKQLNRVLPVFAVLALLVTVNSFAAKMDMHTSSRFQGPKANTPLRREWQEHADGVGRFQGARHAAPGLESRGDRRRR